MKTVVVSIPIKENEKTFQKFNFVVLVIRLKISQKVIDIAYQDTLNGTML